jgi:hypothetical protein
MTYIQYEKTDGVNIFVDVLALDDHQLSDLELENLKETRFQRWLSAINIPQSVSLDSSVENISDD